MAWHRRSARPVDRPSAKLNRVEASGLAARAAELGMSQEEFSKWQPQLSPRLAAALLSALIRSEDALRELSQGEGTTTRSTT